MLTRERDGTQIMITIIILEREEKKKKKKTLNIYHQTEYIWWRGPLSIERQQKEIAAHR